MLSQSFPETKTKTFGTHEVIYISEWTLDRQPSHPSVPTLKKLPLRSVRPLGGFQSGVLEAMLSSCPQDWPTLTSGVCLRLGRCQQRPELCGSKNTLFSCGATRGNSRFGHSRCYGGAGLLECTQCVSVSPLSSCFLQILLSFSFNFTAYSLFVPPFLAPSSLPQSFFFFFFNLIPVLDIFFSLDCCSLITCLSCFLPLSVFSPPIFSSHVLIHT